MSPHIFGLAPSSIAVTVLALSVAMPAHAFSPLKECAFADIQTWETATYTAVLSTVSFPVGTARTIEAFDIIESWDDSRISDVGLNVVPTSGTFTVFDPNDDSNQVGFVSTLPLGVAGLTDVRGDGCTDFQELVEADIMLNVLYNWPSVSRQYDFMDEEQWSGNLFIHDTLRHEVGHAIGFGHTAFGWDSAEHLATMNPMVGPGTVTGEDTYISVRKLYLSEDERQGRRIFYPGNSGTFEDLAAQSYFYDEEAILSTRCSAFARPNPAYTNLTYAAAAEGAPLGDCPVLNPTLPPPNLEVYAGAAIDMTFTLLNLGRNTKTPNARVVLTSENSSNPTTYTVVETFTPTIVPNLPFERDVTIVVPSSLAGAGVLYAVLQLDYDLLVTESDESNNNAIWNRKIEVLDVPLSCGCNSGSSAGLPLGALLLGGIMVARRRRK